MINKNLIAGVLIALVFGVGIASAGVGLEDVLKNAVIGLDTRVATLEEKVFTEEEMMAEVDKTLGGVSRSDILDLTWLKTGQLASSTTEGSTDGTYNAKVLLKSIAADGDSDDYLYNNSKGNWWVSVKTLDFDGTASSTMGVYVATSSAKSLTDYTHAGEVPSAAFGQVDTLIHAFFATSTVDFSISATNTPAMLLRPTEFVVLEVINSNHVCVGGSDTSVAGNAGKCESATSTTRGFDVRAVLSVTATSTPVFNTNR